MKTSRPAMRDVARALLAGLVTAAFALPAQAAIDLPELMKLLGHRASGEARFTEQRFVHGLDAPLVASGTLSFTAPDRFERRTLAPRAESMKVEGDKVTLSRGGRTKTLQLDASPEAQVAVEAVRGTLTGNAAALQKWFRVKVAGDADAWTMELAPVDSATAGPLLAVKMTGRRDELRSVETRLAGGDTTVMTIEPAPAP